MLWWTILKLKSQDPDERMRSIEELGRIEGRRAADALASFTSVRKVPTFSTDVKTIGPDSPTVLTLKVLYCYPGLPLPEQGSRGRTELLSTSFREYEGKIREQLAEMFSRSGFDPRRDIAGIILNRWGHAYVSPQPGFFFGKDGKPAPRESFVALPSVELASPTLTWPERWTTRRPSWKRIVPWVSSLTRC